ncbi:MAG: hypothetical protein F4Z14_00515 [Gammaproteobacteria bacterium]|nr:hypothetical protein [Gammaproteobacteria bacterium]
MPCPFLHATGKTTGRRYAAGLASRPPPRRGLMGGGIRPDPDRPLPGRRSAAAPAYYTYRRFDLGDQVFFMPCHLVLAGAVLTSYNYSYWKL